MKEWQKQRQFNATLKWLASLMPRKPGGEKKKTKTKIKQKKFQQYIVCNFQFADNYTSKPGLPESAKEIEIKLNNK